MGILMGGFCTAIILLKYFNTSTFCQHLKGITFLCGLRKIRKWKMFIWTMS